MVILKLRSSHHEAFGNKHSILTITYLNKRDYNAHYMTRTSESIVSRCRNFIKRGRQLTPPPDLIKGSDEQDKLMNVIQENAHLIGNRVRTNGQQRYGPMWAEGHARLPDGRDVFLQQSLTEGAQHGVLEINILAASGHDASSVHIRYDLEDDDICTYEARQGEEPTILYSRHDPQADRIPGRLLFPEIIRPAEHIFSLVEVASNVITWPQQIPPVTTA